jgi:hypothetical protein
LKLSGNLVIGFLVRGSAGKQDWLQILVVELILYQGKQFYEEIILE